MDGSNFASSRAFSFELALRMTTNLAETRRSLVQSLRKLAKTCKVPVEKLPKDTAGRQKVQALAATVAASAGPEDAKEQFSAELRALDLKDLHAKRKPLGKSALQARVRRVLQTRKAKTVASRIFLGFRKTCQECVDKSGRATKG